MSDGRTVAQLSERFAIYNLLEEYAWKVDHRLYNEWIQLFTEDGVFRVWDEDHVGHEAILKLVQDTYDRLAFLRHHMMVPSIIFTGPGQARIRLYFQLVGATKSGHEVVGAGAYRNQLVRTPSGWKIRRLEAIFDYFTRLENGWVNVERGWNTQSIVP